MSDRPTVLILGGTGEARAVAAELDQAGVRVISSLAGRVARPRLPVGEVRIGGFGGPERLADWLVDQRIASVVDATHPFAERISASAAAACTASGVPLLRLQRPGWTAQPGDDWHWVESLEEAAALVSTRQLTTTAPRVFLTSGRQGLAAFRDAGDAWFLVRCVDPPDPADLPPHHELLLDRGPYTHDGELGLMDRHAIDLLVTKDSGGSLTAAKLDAARELGLPVILVRRPTGPNVATVESVAGAARWVRVTAPAQAKQFRQRSDGA